MSIARLVVTAVKVEGRSRGEVVRTYGISRRWVHELVKRFEVEGEAGLQPRSRRPWTSPQQVSQVVEDEIVALRKTLSDQGLDAGGGHLAARRRHRHRDPQHHRRPFPAGDRLPRPARIQGGRCRRSASRTPFTRHGLPASVLTDNGAIFTATPRGQGRVAFEKLLDLLGIRAVRSRPYHPQTCGKVCEDLPRRSTGRSDPGKGVTVVSFVRSVDRAGAAPRRVPAGRI